MLPREPLVTPAETSRVLRVINPFDAPGAFLKGGLHVHTTASDGALTPEETLRRYRAGGFDFLALSDHESVTFPAEIPDGLIWIPAVEYASRKMEPPGGQWHIVSVGTEKCLAMQGYPVKTILALLSEVSPFTIVAHPYWSNQGGDDLVALPAFDAVEAYNHGAEMSLERGHAELLWDYMSGSGRRAWGLASDDAHHPVEIGATWLRVRVAERSRSAIVGALKAGLFYSTSGPEFLDIRVDSKGVRVRTSPVQSISFVSDRMRGAWLSAEPGSSLTEAAYEYKGNESYLRVQATDAEGKSAWTNLLCVWDRVPDESKATNHEQ